MASIAKAAWNDLVENQNVKDVLGAPMKISGVFNLTEFPLVQKKFSHAIEINATGKDAIYAALFFENVLTILTDDYYLDFFCDEQQDGASIKQAFSNDQFLDLNVQGYDVKKLIQDSHLKISEVTQSQNNFNKALLDVQLKGALFRNLTSQDQPYISDKGVDTYVGLLNIINEKLKNASCLYLMGICLLASRKKNHESVDYTVSELQRAHENIKNWIPDVDHYRPYGSMVSVQHKDKVYILINNFIASSLPFVQDKIRTSVRPSPVQKLFLSQVEKNLADKGFVKPDKDRYSSMEKRLNDVVYHSIHDAMNLFKIAISIKLKYMANKTERNEYLEIKKASKQNLTSGPLCLFSVNVKEILEMTVEIESKSEEAVKIHSNWLSKLSKRVTENDRSILQTTVKHFYEGLPVDQKKLDTSTDYEPGVAEKKLGCMILIRDIVDEILGTAKGKGDEKQVYLKEKPVSVSIAHWYYFVKCLNNESFFIDNLFVGESQVKIKYLTGELRKQMKLDQESQNDKLYKVPSISMLLSLESLDDDKKKDINAYVQNCAIQKVAIDKLLANIIQSISVSGIKSNLFSLFVHIKFEFQLKKVINAPETDIPQPQPIKSGFGLQDLLLFILITLMIIIIAFVLLV